jgi:hypothetical protein
MHCEGRRGPEGGMMFICGRGRQPRPRCAVCGVRPGTQLCDGVVQDIPVRQTCDKPLCTACSVRVRPDGDFCPDHQPQAVPEAEQLALGMEG